MYMCNGNLGSQTTYLMFPHDKLKPHLERKNDVLPFSLGRLRKIRARKNKYSEIFKDVLAARLASYTSRRDVEICGNVILVSRYVYKSFRTTLPRYFLL